MAELGPTVAGQAAYNLPADLYRILSLSVDGKPWGSSDLTTQEEIAASWSTLLVPPGAGIYFTTFNSSGTEQVSLYRVPTVSGKSISAQIVYRPVDLVNAGDVPPVPPEFHRALVHYAASINYGMDEDNVELHAYHQQAFINFVEDLRSLRYSRQGRGPVLMGIQGVHWA